VQSISSEDTLASDLLLDELPPLIRALAARTWAASRGTSRIGRTVVLKLKTADFQILTRSHTPPTPPRAETEFVEIAVALCARVTLPQRTRYRLVGVGLGNFLDADEIETQAELFV
jgi:DNA polymerase-4